MNLEKNSELFEHALKVHNDMLSRKRHIEVKILSILQATAILTVLFSAVQSYCKNYEIFNSIIIMHLSILFYLFTVITIIVLLYSLDDKICNRFNKGDEGLYKETLLPYEIYLKAKEIDREDFLLNMIVDYNDSIESGKKILIKKNKYFLKGVRFFIYAIFTLIVIGIIIMFGGN